MLSVGLLARRIAQPSSYQRTAVGTGRYFVNETSYGVYWSLQKADNRYYLYEWGFWHPAYDGLSRDALTYPISSFTTHSDTFGPQIQYTKN